MNKLLFFFAALSFAACTSPQAPKEGLSPLQTDVAFNKMSADKGYKQAFIAYADTDAVQFRDGKPPLKGIAEIKGNTSIPDLDMSLSWVPVKEEVAASGDLAYTWGNWVLFVKNSNTTYYGVYVTVW